MNNKDITAILEEIGLSAAEISVYQALLDGAHSAHEILRISGEKRPTVYYALGALEKRGLLSKTGKEYGNKYQIEPIASLTEIVKKNIRKQELLLKKTQQIAIHYPDKTVSNKVTVSYYDSLESVRLAIFQSLYCKSHSIKSIVPADNFFHEIGKDFVREYVREKMKRKISTLALWEDIPSRKIMDEYYQKAEVRQLPTAMHNSFDTTILQYDDKTLYISPKKEQYAVLIQSRAHAKMTQAMFKQIWDTSIKLT